MIESYYIFMLDTLMRNNKPSKGASELLDKLHARHMPFAIMTEQSGRTAEEIAEKMNQCGFRGIASDDIYSSSMAAVDWILRMYPQKNKAALIGGRGMKDAVENGNILINHIDPDWLILGMNANLTYIDYCDALQVLDDGAQMILTDERATLLKDNARMIGTKSVASMLAYASGKDYISFGRGTERFLKQGMKHFNVPAENALMIGSSFQKDICPALSLGMNTIYVTFGTSIEGLGMDDACHPDYIVEDLFGLIK
jgi:4-nitrophenyl phosphatase